MWLVWAACSDMTETTITVYKPTSSNVPAYVESAATYPELPALPPNYAMPRAWVARQSDAAPCSLLAQTGFWLNGVGRRRAA
jgi:hypothetical protein